MADELFPWIPPELDEHDVAAVIGMLARVIRIDEANKIDRAMIADLTKAVAERGVERAKYVTGIGAFGFDMAGNEVWVRVRSGIGDAAYDKAIAISKTSPKPALKMAPPVEDDDDASPPDGDSDDGPAEAERDVPKVRDAILDYLLSLPEGQGAQVPAIKNYLAQTFKIETHEKTPGMTLYRLSKDELVRRDGRTWFAVRHSPENYSEPETDQ